MSWQIVETHNSINASKNERLMEFHFIEPYKSDNHTLSVLCMPDGYVRLLGDKDIKIIDARGG